ncbi:hypothetical protein [Alterinioella nitratireducens]|uniref:hypothetical protein n=1 Tax=Alterinioella nitratireducens TaxID=2735915 RepID=UPI0015548A35|nr:hypothetical protein [Alterinioella nitratireducens]NPD19023.1 hypothetical protein [Alterinioella nitratireducens]|tara:strand:- start:606 stop:779 length:174 start_codon:yes stop_codon:yes gene_type:complete
MELIFAIAITALAAGGIGLGLAFGRGPVRSSCGATDRLAKDRCEDCPLRRAAREGRK